jgi:hypothetical protein
MCKSLLLYPKEMLSSGFDWTCGPWQLLRAGLASGGVVCGVAAGGAGASKKKEYGFSVANTQLAGRELLLRIARCAYANNNDVQTTTT